ncbi:hypothetical protein Droror1_Dr00017487 [Drosera rotundifolia]
MTHNSSFSISNQSALDSSKLAITAGISGNTRCLAMACSVAAESFWSWVRCFTEALGAFGGDISWLKCLGGSTELLVAALAAVSSWCALLWCFSHGVQLWLFSANNHFSLLGSHSVLAGVVVANGVVKCHGLAAGISSGLVFVSRRRLIGGVIGGVVVLSWGGCVWGWVSRRRRGAVVFWVW